MPSLRELLQHVEERDKGISQSAYDLLKALVETVEAIGVNKHIASLAHVHTELAEAKAEIERLREVSDDTEAYSSLADKMAERLRKERDETKAEIGVFRNSRGYWKQQCQDARERYREAEAVVKSLVANAEIGRRVRGMRSASRLFKQGNYYWAEFLGDIPEYPSDYQGAIGHRASFCTRRTPNPEEALRTIQEVGDA